MDACRDLLIDRLHGRHRPLRFGPIRSSTDVRAEGSTMNRVAQAARFFRGRRVGVRLQNPTCSGFEKNVINIKK